MEETKGLSGPSIKIARHFYAGGGGEGNIMGVPVVGVERPVFQKMMMCGENFYYVFWWKSVCVELEV